MRRVAGIDPTTPNSIRRSLGAETAARAAFRLRPRRPKAVTTLAVSPTPAQRYSFASLLRHALAGHRDWRPAWRRAEPKAAYDVVIVGAGGHGLAAAYYLAVEHGLRNVAVVEKGWLGGGNIARNTTIVRSNYLLPENAAFYEYSLKLWEGLTQKLNFNLMFSQRGSLNLAHDDGQVEAMMRRGNAMRLYGIDAEFMSPGEVKRIVPRLDVSASARFPYPRRPAAAARRHGAARRDRLGLRPRDRRDGRGHHRELRSHRLCADGLADRRGANEEGRHPGQESGARRGGPQQHARRHGRSTLADRNACPASDGVRSGEAGSRRGRLLADGRALREPSPTRANW